MDWKIKSKISDLNNARVNYLTIRNKPLSIVILLLLLILLSLAKPLLASMLIVTYGLVFIWAIINKH